MDTMKSITPDDITASREAFDTDRTSVVAKNAVSSAGIRTAARVPEAIANNTLQFDIEVTQGDRTDQERSGRCWMFASLNTMRYRTIKRFNLKTFELSQAYPSSSTSSRRATGFSRTSWTRSTSPLATA